MPLESTLDTLSTFSSQKLQHNKAENGIINYFGAMKLTGCRKLWNGKKSYLEDLEQRGKEEK